MSKQHSRLHKAALVASAGALAAVAVATPAHAASATTTDAVNLRSAASTSSQVLLTVAGGQSVEVECQTTGDNVSGTYNSNWWAKTTVNGQTGYLSRAYVTIPHGTDVPTCSDAPAPDPAPEPAPGGDVSATTPHEVGAPISREHAKARGMFWIEKHVPYSMEAWTAGPLGRNYRTDCSGFVSMAFHLPEDANTKSRGEKYFTPIPKSELRPGDVIGNLTPDSLGAAGHVVIFDGWVEGSNQTQFHSIEQRGGNGSWTGVRNFGDSYWNKQGYRYNKISN